VNSDDSETLAVSKECVASLYELFRNKMLFFCKENCCMLGGDNICVHIDETPITKGMLGKEKLAVLKLFG
jgi:hypothetical protein